MSTFKVVIDGESRTATHIDCDQYGKPRCVVHYTAFFSSGTGEVSNDYEIALDRARVIGGKKFHNKQYGGGIVFTTYNLQDDIDKWLPKAAVGENYLLYETLTVNGKQHEVWRVKDSSRGEPRYVVYYDAFADNYFDAILKVKSVGGKEYRGTWYAGGIVFTTNDLQATVNKLFV